MPPLPAIPKPSSIGISMSKIIREMRSMKGPYQDALRDFKRQYVVCVFVRNACHLGRTAEELGMHHNTLTRAIRELGIDAKEIRRAMRCRSEVNTVRDHHLFGPQHPERSSLAPAD
jgi:hypothetical protein